MRILSAGVRAPEFVLRRTPDQDLALSELRGRPVILAFYPADFSPVCGAQMELYNELTSGKRREASEARRGSSDNQAAQERGNP
jgi:peroxiredoxin